MNRQRRNPPRIEVYRASTRSNDWFAKNRGLIATAHRHEMFPHPETLPHMILLLLPKRPDQMNCALALDETRNRRHGILRRNRGHHVQKVDHQMMANSLAKTAQPFRAKERRIAEGLVSDQD